MPAGLPEVMIEEAKKSIPLGRAGTPEDVTNAMLCLDSEKSSYIIGHILDLNGGSS
jgi:3-oxoacyl-[acyl-carrier protein] reductase